MKYETKETSYLDSGTKHRTTIGEFKITGLNSVQYERIRKLVIEMYDEESSNC